MSLARFLTTLAIACCVLLIAGSTAKAGTITFTATLSGANEVPVKTTNGSGTATLILDDATGKLTLTVVFQDLTSTVTGAHIHASAPPGVNAGVLQGFDQFLTLNATKTGGSLTSFVLPITLTQQQMDNLKAGLFYINVHTLNNPSGEIRGQFAAVPEPQTLALLGAGLAALAGRRLRRKTE